MWNALFAALCLAYISDVKSKVVNEIQFTDEISGHPPTAQERIVNGEIAREGMFPFVVAIYFYNEYICTGSLISDTKVLTAAHCVVQEGFVPDARYFYGICGNTNRSALGMRIYFSRIKVHPRYDPNTVKHDIAFLELKSAIALNNGLVERICIAKSSFFHLKYKFGTAIGWGVTDGGEDSPAAEKLHFVDLAVCNNVFCKLVYNGSISDEQMCAQIPFSGKGICFGDSGGPFVCGGWRNGPFVQFGIASFISKKYGCGSLLLGPSVFTRMTSYADWLLWEAKDKNICYI